MQPKAVSRRRAQVHVIARCRPQRIPTIAQSRSSPAGQGPERQRGKRTTAIAAFLQIRCRAVFRPLSRPLQKPVASRCPPQDRRLRADDRLSLQADRATASASDGGRADRRLRARHVDGSGAFAKVGKDRPQTLGRKPAASMDKAITCTHTSPPTASHIKAGMSETTAATMAKPAWRTTWPFHLRNAQGKKPRRRREMKNVWPEARYQPLICRKRMRISYGRSVDRMGRSGSGFLSKANPANGGMWSFLRSRSPRMTADRSRSPSIPGWAPRAESDCGADQIRRTACRATA